MFFWGEKMFKVLLILCLTLLPVFSKTIDFYEEKYIDALDKTFTKKGKISFLKNKIEIVYSHDNSILTYTGEYLITEKNNKFKKMDLSKKPSVKMFFLLFEAIYFNKKQVLQAYFSSKEAGGITELIPHESISDYIESVRFKKSSKKLDFLDIKLSNKDRIHIEETH